LAEGLLRYRIGTEWSKNRPKTARFRPCQLRKPLPLRNYGTTKRLMENYDIDRTGYHDMHDTMANIDLDYGAAVTAIAIESVAREATEKPLE
jgi:hypothetical protein